MCYGRQIYHRVAFAVFWVKEYLLGRESQAPLDFLGGFGNFGLAYSFSTRNCQANMNVTQKYIPSPGNLVAILPLACEPAVPLAKGWDAANFDEAARLGDSFRASLDNGLSNFLLNGSQSYDALQARLFVFYALKTYVRVFNNIKIYVASRPILNSQRFKKLKAFIRYFSTLAQEAAVRIAHETDFALAISRPYYAIHGRELRDPLTVSLISEELGYTVNCLELPQIYGYGETEEEAFTMFEDEVASMKKDLEEATELTYENFCLYLMLKKVFKNEKRSV